MWVKIMCSSLPLSVLLAPSLSSSLPSHGQFGMMKDKRTPYEFDIHLPAFVRGPGITPGSVVGDPITNVDFYPTFLDIAGERGSSSNH